MILSRAEQAVLVALLVLFGLGLVAFGYLAGRAGWDWLPAAVLLMLAVCVAAGVLVASRRG